MKFGQLLHYLDVQLDVLLLQFTILLLQLLYLVLSFGKLILQGLDLLKQLSIAVAVLFGDGCLKLLLQLADLLKEKLVFLLEISVLRGQRANLVVLLPQLIIANHLGLKLLDEPVFIHKL